MLELLLRTLLWRQENKSILFKIWPIKENKFKNVKKLNTRKKNGYLFTQIFIEKYWN